MKTILIFLFSLGLGFAGEGKPVYRTRSTTTDGIEITAATVSEPGGRILVRCTLRNHTEHLLAGAFARTRGKAFRITMRNAQGDIIPMDSEWALVHGQPDGTNNGDIDSKSLTAVVLSPGEACRFDFFLHEAYGERVGDGTELEVKWINSYSRGEGPISVQENSNVDGSITLGRTEKNHFPGRRVFEVKLPLTDEGEASSSPAAPSPPSPPNPDSGTETVSPNRKEQGAGPSSAEPFDHRRWLFLLLIPVAFFTFRMLRSGKAT